MTTNTGRNMTPGNLISIRTNWSRFSLPASNEMGDDSMPNQKPCARLENWAVVESANLASYQALRAGSLLVGKVFSHPTIAEGKFIFSSPIVQVDEKTKVAETRNTSYCLGQASREYQIWIEERRGAAA